MFGRGTDSAQEMLGYLETTQIYELLTFHALDPNAYQQYLRKKDGHACFKYGDSDAGCHKCPAPIIAAPELADKTSSPLRRGLYRDHFRLYVT